MNRLSRYSFYQDSRRILFVDTETTGISLDMNLSYRNIDNWPSIKQIAWIICKKDGTFVTRQNYAIAEDNTSPAVNSPNYVSKTIMPIHEILKFFMAALDSCDVIVGHNIEYDVNVILSELHRYGYDTSRLSSMQQFCTMKNSIDICGFDTSHGDRYPKLQELYSKLFHHPFNNAHDAFCDIQATAECFWEFFSRGLLKKENFPYLLSSAEINNIADKHVADAVEMVDRYVKRGCRAKDEPPTEALSLFDRALQLKPYSSEFKDKVGKACLQCARDMYSGGGMPTSFRFFDKAAETEYGEALAVKARLADSSDEKERLLLKAIDKGWIDAAEDLFYLYKRKNSFLADNTLANKYSQMWLDYCEASFDSLPYSIATRYIRVFVFGEMGRPADYDKAKDLCERAIANGLENYSQYAKLLELREEWDKRFEILNTDYTKYLDKFRDKDNNQSVHESIMKKGQSPEECNGLIIRLCPLVECLFEGRGTKVDYFKAKDLIDFGLSRNEYYSGSDFRFREYVCKLLYVKFKSELVIVKVILS